MSKTKELIICIISIAVLILAAATNVFATDLEALTGNVNETNENEFQQITDSDNNTNVNTTAGTINVNDNTNTNNTNNTVESIPYTGVNYSVIVIIAICGVSAIYAYKKIRDYNV